MLRTSAGVIACLMSLVAAPVSAGVIVYGDVDLFGFAYSGDPTSGLVLSGLAPNAISNVGTQYAHGFPFDPGVADFPGTDQIYAGSAQTTTAWDGYAAYGGRLNGPQSLQFDYASLVPAQHVVTSLTLGLAVDDFQYAWLHYHGVPEEQPFEARINGLTHAALTNFLNSLNLTVGSGTTSDPYLPSTLFFTIGIDPALLTASHQLTLSIDQAGPGGDGWALDFATVGVETTAVPEPATVLLVGLGLTACRAMVRRRLA